jgi:hypothetical protein
LLSWDEPIGVPFPEHLRLLVESIDWKSTTWQSFGLPVHLGKYSIVGKLLYLDELADGTQKVVREEITGTIYASVLLMDNIDFGTSHYAITFSITFVKGEILEIKLAELQSLDKVEYNKNIQNFQNSFKKKLKFKNSWFYKNIYIPYYFILKAIFFIPLWILMSLQYLVVGLFKLLTWSWNE